MNLSIAGIIIFVGLLAAIPPVLYLQRKDREHEQNRDR